MTIPFNRKLTDMNLDEELEAWLSLQSPKVRNNVEFNKQVEHPDPALLDLREPAYSRW